jgi:hypothetical protein
MRRWLVLSFSAAMAWAAVAVAAAPPMLRSAVPSNGHLVVTFVSGDLVPGEVVVATRGTRATTGGLAGSSVKLRERITARTDPETGQVRYRTRGKVRPGAYFVIVSGFLQDPPASCGPIRSHCAERWSNVLRIRVA